VLQYSTIEFYWPPRVSLFRFAYPPTVFQHPQPPAGPTSTPSALLRYVFVTRPVVLQSVAVCCSVLQYVAVCCSVLQCVAVCQLRLHRANARLCLGLVCCSVLQSVTVLYPACVMPMLAIYIYIYIYMNIYISIYINIYKYIIITKNYFFFNR